MANNQAVLDSIFHALADSTRRAVIQRLGKGSASVSDLAEQFDMALPSFLKHIHVLEAAGLINSNKVGRVRTCTIEQKKLAVVEEWVGEQRAIWDSRYKNLDGLLTQLKGE